MDRVRIKINLYIMWAIRQFPACNDLFLRKTKTCVFVSPVWKYNFFLSKTHFCVFVFSDTVLSISCIIGTQMFILFNVKVSKNDAHNAKVIRLIISKKEASCTYVCQLKMGKANIDKLKMMNDIVTFSIIPAKLLKVCVSSQSSNAYQSWGTEGGWAWATRLRLLSPGFLLSSRRKPKYFCLSSRSLSSYSAFWKCVRLFSDKDF